MRTLICSFLLLSPLFGATKIRLHDSPSSIAGYKAMDLSLGPPQLSQVTSITNTTASGTSIQATKTGGGTALAWISEPLAAGFTLSGTVTCNVYGKEAATGNNATLQCQLYKYSGSEGSSIFSANFGSELTTSMLVKNWTGTPTSTAYATGDRVVLKLFIINSGTMGAGSPGVTVDYEGPTDAADGSTWVQLNETVTFTPDGGAGGTPDIVQWVATPNVGNGSQLLGAGATVKVVLPMLSKAGNLIAIHFWYQAGTVWSVSDDQSNTYTLGPTCQEAGNVHQVTMYYAQNVAASTRVITVSHTTGTAQYFSALAYELKNVATSGALDASSCNVSAGGSTAPDAGSMTPLTSGDLLVQFFGNESAATATSITAGSQGNITWGLLAAERYYGIGAQYGTYTSTSAITPTMAKGDSAAWTSNAVAFKPSLAGAGPDTTGIYIRGAQSTTYQTGQTTPVTLQFPTACGLIIDMYQGGQDDCPTAVSSSPSNTWANTGACVTLGSTTRYWYAANATPSLAMTMTITMNQTAVSDDGHLILDVCGANTSQGTVQNVTGTGSKTGVTPLDTVTITPVYTNSLVLTSVAQDFNTNTGITNAGCLTLHGVLSTNTLNTFYYENNGWAYCLNHSASAIAVDWTYQGGIGADDLQWSARAAEFLGPSSAATILNRSLLGVGK